MNKCPECPAGSTGSILDNKGLCPVCGTRVVKLPKSLEDLTILHAMWCIDCYSLAGNKIPAHFMYEGMSLCEEHMAEEIKNQGEI